MEHAIDELERAIQDFGEAIRLKSQPAIVYANRARAYTLMGRDEEARQDVERAIALNFVRSHLEVEIARLKTLR